VIIRVYYRRDACGTNSKNLIFRRQYDVVGARLKPFRSTGSLLLALALVPIFLAGCASPYVVILTTGQRYTTPEKPDVQQINGQYDFVFTDSTGQTNFVPSGLVRAVVPASEIKPAQ
jgi:hypothetical protein